MAPIERNRNKTSYGGGRNRQMAITMIMEAGIKIVNVARASKVPDVYRSDFVATVSHITILISSFYCLYFRRIPAVEESYLESLLASDPINMPFAMDVWAFHKKVLNAVYDGYSVTPRSFRRGPWEELLLATANTSHISSGALVIQLRTKECAHRNNSIIVNMNHGTGPSWFDFLISGTR